VKRERSTQIVLVIGFLVIGFLQIVFLVTGVALLAPLSAKQEARYALIRNIQGEWMDAQHALLNKA
jgi:hypothetical protein